MNGIGLEGARLVTAFPPLQVRAALIRNNTIVVDRSGFLLWGGCCRSLCFSLVPLLAFSFCARLRRGGTCGGVFLLLRVRIALAHDNTVVVGRSGLLL